MHIDPVYSKQTFSLEKKKEKMNQPIDYAITCFSYVVNKNLVINPVYKHVLCQFMYPVFDYLFYQVIDESYRMVSHHVICVR